MMKILFALCLLLFASCTRDVVGSFRPFLRAWC